MNTRRSFIGYFLGGVAAIAAGGISLLKKKSILWEKTWITTGEMGEIDKTQMSETTWTWVLEGYVPNANSVWHKSKGPPWRTL